MADVKKPALVVESKETEVYETILESTYFDSSETSSTSEKIKQQTRVQRLFSFAQLFFLSLTFMSGWETMALNLYNVFYNGGPQVLVWGALLVISGALCQSASLAELSSIQPIAGAQYHWTHLFAPRRMRNVISWMQGWITLFGWISLLAGIAQVTTAMLEGIVILNYPDFVFERWHTTLIIFAILVFQALMNTFVFWIVPWFELLTGVLHVCLFIVYMTVLLTLSKKHDADFVFLDRVDSSTTSGWTNSFVSWNLGLLTPVWGFVGFDGAVHLSEEAKRSRQTVPRVMFWTIFLNGILAYSFILVILYCAGDIAAALASPTYQPFLYICHQVTGSRAVATAMGCGLLVISLSVNLAAIASVSRLTWAWARDGGLPAYFAYVSEKQKVPVRSVWLSTVTVMVLALLNIPSSVAFSAFIALSTLSLFLSYLISIGCMIYSRLTMSNIQLGKWNLGRWGWPINLWAFFYTLYMIIWLPFPQTLPVTAVNMNWAGPILGGVILLAAILWLVRNPKWPWQGPNVEVIREALKGS